MTTPERLTYTDFDVPAVLAGKPLTAAEREFLIRDTPQFEECGFSATHLQTMTDPELMRAAHDVWADYASTQV